MILDCVLQLWFIFTGLSLAFVLWDILTNTPVSWGQKLAWVLVIVHAGAASGPPRLP